MPSPLEHLVIANTVAMTLGSRAVGTFLGGTVAPDVDKLIGWPRVRTHWWNPETLQSGALCLIAAHPALCHFENTSPLAAFVAGYLCHLVVDEQWTIRIHRRHFGKYSRFQASQEGAELQWALQAAMDTHLIESGALRTPVRALQAAVADGTIQRGALAVLPEAVDEVMAFVQSASDRSDEPDSQSRFRMMASARAIARHGSPDLAPAPDQTPPRFVRPTDSDAELERFLDRLPTLQAEASRIVSPDEISDFRRVAIDESVSLLSDYLDGRPLTAPAGTTPLTPR